MENKLKIKTAKDIVQSYQQEEWVYFEDAVKALEEYAELFTSVIDKLLNEGNPKYTDADKFIIKDSIDRHMNKGNLSSGTIKINHKNKNL